MSSCCREGGTVTGGNSVHQISERVCVCGLVGSSCTGPKQSHGHFINSPGIIHLSLPRGSWNLELIRLYRQTGDRCFRQRGTHTPLPAKLHGGHPMKYSAAELVVHRLPKCVRGWESGVHSDEGVHSPWGYFLPFTPLIFRK